MMFENDRSVAKNILLDFLYDSAEHYLGERLNRIIQKNLKHNGSRRVTGSCIYKGQLYKTTSAFNSKLNFYLDKEYHNEMEEYLKINNEVENEKEVIDRFLTVFFTKATNSKNIEKVLGKILFSKIAQMMYFTFTEIVNSKEDINFMQFAAENSEYIDMMQKRAIDNLIMQEIYERY